MRLAQKELYALGIDKVLFAATAFCHDNAYHSTLPVIAPLADPP